MKIFVMIEKSFIDDLWDYKITFMLMVFRIINSGLKAELIWVKLFRNTPSLWNKMCQ